MPDKDKKSFWDDVADVIQKINHKLLPPVGWIANHDSDKSLKENAIDRVIEEIPGPIIPKEASEKKAGAFDLQAPNIPNEKSNSQSVEAAER